MKKNWILVLALGLNLCCFKASAQNLDAADTLIKALEKINTFQAHYDQKIRDANGEPVGNTQGKIIIRRPGRFYSKSEGPDPMLVVADGQYLWTYDIELSQVTKQEIKDSLKNSPAELLAGKVSTLKQNFKISFAKSNRCHMGSDQCYLLHPMQKDAGFSDILIGFAKDKLTEVKMHDSLGQEVHTFFSRIEINGKVNNDIFAFKPPRGVDIIHSEN